MAQYCLGKLEKSCCGGNIQAETWMKWGMKPYGFVREEHSSSEYSGVKVWYVCGTSWTAEWEIQKVARLGHAGNGKILFWIREEYIDGFWESEWYDLT